MQVYVFPILKALLHVSLVVIFWVIFGRVSVGRFEKQNVLVSSSTIGPDPEGLQVPAITICRRNTNSSIGWKGAQNSNITTLKEVLRHTCGEYQNVTKCIEEETFDLDQVVSMAKIGMTHSWNSNIYQIPDKSLMDPKFWIKDFTWTRDGFCYTLNSSIRVGTDYEQSVIAFYANDTDMHQIIYIHDPDFFVVNANPMALSKTRIKVMANSFRYQRIALVEHSLINHAKIPCEPRRDYSFQGCVRNSFTAKVKCRLPWPAMDPSAANAGVPVCQNLTQFLHFEKLYAQLEAISTSSIENITKCVRPCHHREYRMVNEPTAISEPSIDFSSIFMFWFVSTETLVEEQSLVYPWQSLVFRVISEQTKIGKNIAFSKSSGG